MIPALYRDLADRAARLAQATTSHVCSCGVDREPVRLVDGCLSIVVCACCGGRTTERRI